jgi:hypothetical protein
MADCDLCGVALPTLCPVKVFMPRFAFAYPKGTEVNLCGKCLKFTHDANSRVSGGSKGECDTCGSKTTVYPVSIEVPSFSKGVDPKTVQICKACLEACSEAQVKKDNEPKSEHH